MCCTKNAENRMLPKHYSAIICGASGCGKSEFVLDLLETEYLGFFVFLFFFF